jgi:hypothetical protein
MDIMNHKRKLVTLIVFALLLSVSSVETGFAKPKKKKEALTGTPIMWERPDDIATRDLYLGPGGAAMRPDVRRITFIKDEKGGYSKKYRVRDGAGREWVVKIGKEAQSETSAIRLKSTIWSRASRFPVKELSATSGLKHVRRIGNELESGSGRAIRFPARRSYRASRS